jgi:hypothetical protein
MLNRNRHHEDTMDDSTPSQPTYPTGDMWVAMEPVIGLHIMRLLVAYLERIRRTADPDWYDYVSSFTHFFRDQLPPDLAEIYSIPRRERSSRL